MADVMRCPPSPPTKCVSLKGGWNGGVTGGTSSVTVTFFVPPPPPVRYKRLLMNLSLPVNEHPLINDSSLPRITEHPSLAGINKRLLVTGY